MAALPASCPGPGNGSASPASGQDADIVDCILTYIIDRKP